MEDIKNLVKENYKSAFTLIIPIVVFVVFGFSADVKAASKHKFFWYEDENGWYVQYDDGSYARNEYIDGYWINDEGYYDATWDGSWKYNGTGWWYEAEIKIETSVENDTDDDYENAAEKVDYYTWYPINSWLKVNGVWYYFGVVGYMETSKWIGNYYVSETGEMLTSCWIEKWYVDSTGKWVDTRDHCGPWKITSYSSKSGSQATIYTIEDKDGHLVIIDGGWESDAEQIRSLIKKHDNHVYAWILSHPHKDHVGAFNNIMKGKSDIKIDNIYVTNLDYARYKETVRWYEDFDSCEKYNQIIKGLNNVHIVNEGDKFECVGTNIEIIHGWDGEVNKLKADICNYGSLVFIVKGDEEKMLFCSDISTRVEDSIVTRHKEKLKDVKYIQVAHHGNWAFLTKLYGAVEAPEKVFLDSPSAYLDLGTKGYDAGKLKAYFVNRGVQVVDYSTAPNSIILY